MDPRITVTDPRWKVDAVDFHDKKNLEECKALGQKAMHAGKPRVPAHDPALMEVIRNMGSKPIGHSSPYLSAWLKGWDVANLEEEHDSETADYPDSYER